MTRGVEIMRDKQIGYPSVDKPWLKLYSKLEEQSYTV